MMAAMTTDGIQRSVENRLRALQVEIDELTHARNGLIHQGKTDRTATTRKPRPRGRTPARNPEVVPAGQVVGLPSGIQGQVWRVGQRRGTRWHVIHRRGPDPGAGSRAGEAEASAPRQELSDPEVDDRFRPGIVRSTRARCDR
jgi:hypothetical protein